MPKVFEVSVQETIVSKVYVVADDSYEACETVEALCNNDVIDMEVLNPNNSFARQVGVVDENPREIAFGYDYFNSERESILPTVCFDGRNAITRKDIAIDPDMEVDCDIGEVITAYIETWFDVDKKFHVCTRANDHEWVNMYAKYNPFKDTLEIECVLDEDYRAREFAYIPSGDEAKLIKEMIAEKIAEFHHQTAKEFCESIREGD